MTKVPIEFIPICDWGLRSHAVTWCISSRRRHFGIDSPLASHKRRVCPHLDTYTRLSTYKYPTGLQLLENYLLSATKHASLVKSRPIALRASSTPLSRIQQSTAEYSTRDSLAVLRMTGARHISASRVTPHRPWKRLSIWPRSNLSRSRAQSRLSPSDGIRVIP